MITVKTVRQFGQLEDISEEWQNLLQKNRVQTVFQSFEWHKSWWQAFGNRYQLHTVIVFQNDAPVAIAPLAIDSKGDLIFIGHDDSDYCDFLIQDTSQIDLIFTEIYREKSHWKKIELINLHQDSLLVDFKYHFPIKVHFAAEAPNCQFMGNEDDLKLANKKSLKRHTNYFTRNGLLTFDHITEVQEIKAHLEGFFQQHIDRRSLTQDKSQFLDPRQKEFYHLICANPEFQKWIKFSILRFNDEVLAYHFGFLFQSQYLWYKPTFNINYLKKSPGEVLLKKLIEFCIEHKVQELDFTVGQEPFKYRFSNQIRRNYDLIGHNNNLLYIASQIREFVASFFRKIPLYRKIKKWLFSKN